MVGISTPVTITMGKLLTGIVSTIVFSGGVLWAVLTFTIGGMREDVGAIRETVKGLNVDSISRAIDNLQTADRSNITRANEINIKLTEQIQGLRIDFVKSSDTMSAKLDSIDKSINGLSDRMDKAQKVNSVTYDPRDFERFADYLRKSLPADSSSRIFVVPFVPPTR